MERNSLVITDFGRGSSDDLPASTLFELAVAG